MLWVKKLLSSSGLHLRQSKYITDLLTRSKMLGVKPYTSSCVVGSKISAHSSDPLSLPMKSRSFAKPLTPCKISLLPALISLLLWTNCIRLKDKPLLALLFSVTSWYMVCSPPSACGGLQPYRTILWFLKRQWNFTRLSQPPLYVNRSSSI
jgi:hypothetical protein